MQYLLKGTDLQDEMEDHCHLENIGKIGTVNWCSNSVENMEFAVELCRLIQLHSIL